MVSEFRYPTSRQTALRLWEWHLLFYWNTVLRDFPNVPLAHLNRLPGHSERMEAGWTWATPTNKEIRSWRLRFLGAKLGVIRPISVENLPEWLFAVVSIRFLDEPLEYFGRPTRTFPARASDFLLA